MRTERVLLVAIVLVTACGLFAPPGEYGGEYGGEAPRDASTEDGE
jgi:hypothetical protein